MNDHYKKEDALVLFSGGQDSTTSLFWAMKNFREVKAVCFYYGQKHAAEVQNAKRICSKLNISFKLIDISFIRKILISDLFKNRGKIQPDNHPLKEGVPSSFVPYRNLLFLTIASGWASTISIRHLVTGVCETDSSGYADCRDIFIKSAQATINLSTDFTNQRVMIHTPLQYLSKADIFFLAEKLGCFEFVLKETLTCYYGKKKMQAFGMGCGDCPACVLRKKGYEEFISKYRCPGDADE